MNRYLRNLSLLLCYFKMEYMIENRIDVVLIVSSLGNGCWLLWIDTDAIYDYDILLPAVIFEPYYHNKYHHCSKHVWCARHLSDYQTISRWNHFHKILCMYMYEHIAHPDLNSFNSRNIICGFLDSVNEAVW